MSELRLTRNQLAEFLPNQRSVLAFEKLLKSTTSTIPTDLDTIYRLITEGSTESASATAKANIVAAELSRVADLLERISLAPPTKHPNQLGVDYIDFAKAAPHTDSVARLDWNQA